MSLQNLDPRWDNQTLEYDLDKHNWPEFWLAVAKEKFPNIESLETVHKTLDVKEVSQLGAYLQQRTGDADFIEKVEKKAIKSSYLFWNFIYLFSKFYNNSFLSKFIN